MTSFRRRIETGARYVDTGLIVQTRYTKNADKSIRELLICGAARHCVTFAWRYFVIVKTVFLLGVISNRSTVTRPG